MTSRSVTVVVPRLLADRWEQVRCIQGKRVVDVNHGRSQIRYFCDRCRRTHTVTVGIHEDGNRVD